MEQSPPEMDAIVDKLEAILLNLVKEIFNKKCEVKV